MKHYYCIYDWTVTAANPGVGFANTNAAVAFDSKQKRDQFVEKQREFDYSCEKITRAQAMTMLVNKPMTLNKGLPLNDIDGVDFYIMRYWRY
jgi:hypothetical protein